MLPAASSFDSSAVPAFICCLVLTDNNFVGTAPYQTRHRCHLNSHLNPCICNAFGTDRQNSSFVKPISFCCLFASDRDHNKRLFEQTEFLCANFILTTPVSTQDRFPCLSGGTG
ncbi:hypothetical protein L596_019334 [Steinernema carpocapsae]|uniref:Uncharacterized protein n=1 Tax=Steinernema carpocapsae TaxID=34508 RepID=A0A4U5MR43_STECR|nr:hypothetical protein L596_019334 [Steinernema carpocapsae]